jgi:hypothetical protein
MTYNFDPTRWYDNERSALEAIRKIEKWSVEDYEKALENLEKRYEEMIRRLDGTYQLPGWGDGTT